MIMLQAMAWSHPVEPVTNGTALAIILVCAVPVLLIFAVASKPLLRLAFGPHRLVNIHLTHRVFVYLFSIAAISLIVLALRRRPAGTVVRAAKVLAGLLVLQIALGGLNVWLTHEYELLILAHLATATLLWGTLTTLSLQLFRIPRASPAPSGQLTTERAVAA